MVALGVVWIAVMTWITWRGIELSARTQLFLLGAEIAALALFAVVALGKVYFGDVAGSVEPVAVVAQPVRHPGHRRAVGPAGDDRGLLLSLFIYWGWDSTVTVNEETEDSTEAPGRAAIWSTIILLGHLRDRLGRGGGLRGNGVPRPGGEPGRRARRAWPTTSSARWRGS